MSDKEQLRYKYKIKRKYFQHAAREVADGAVLDAALSAYSCYDSFFIYHSYGSEADTHTLIDELLKADKRVYLPRIEGGEMLAVRYFGDGSALVKNSFGIYEPSGEPANEEIDICITPLLAVNPQGYRLGYGGGYYDRYFSAHKGIRRVGLGYFLQYGEGFAPEKWDEPLDEFVCERGIIYFGR